MDKQVLWKQLEEMGIRIDPPQQVNRSETVTCPQTIKCPRCSKIVQSDLVTVSRNLDTKKWQSTCKGCDLKWEGEYAQNKTKKRFQSPMSEEVKAQRRENARLYAARRRAEAKKAKQGQIE